MTPTHDEIVHVVGEEAAQEWEALQDLRLYTLNAEAYGLVGQVRVGDIVHIASSVRDPALPFTTAMLKDIITLIRTQRVVIITDHPDYHAHIKRVLLRYNMQYEVIDGILYSRNFT